MPAFRKVASTRSNLPRNSTTRLVTSMITSRLDYCSSILEGLLAKQTAHQQKVQTTFAYCHYEGSRPPYLSASLSIYQPSSSLRSAHEKLLKIPKNYLKTFGPDTFTFLAPSIWNSLSADLRSSPSLSYVDLCLSACSCQMYRVR